MDLEEQIAQTRKASALRVAPEEQIKATMPP